MRGPALDREILLRLLVETGDAYSACRSALESGVRFEVWENEVPIAALARIYTQRARRMREKSQPNLGASEALAALRSCDMAAVSIGFVDDRPNGGYYFQLFLKTDLSKVVACVGVKASKVGV